MYSLIHVESSKNNMLSIADFFTTKFDYVIKKEMYKPYKNTLMIYDLLRQIMVDEKKTIITPIVTLSPDTSISASTLAGAAEKFMYCETVECKPVYKTSLHVIYIDTTPNLIIKKYESSDDYKMSVLSDVMGLNDDSFSLHRVDIPASNITIIGINEETFDDEQEFTLNKHNITYFTLKKMSQNIIKIMEKLISQLQYKNIHVVINLSCMDFKSAPSVVRESKTGFDIEQIKLVCSYLKKLNRLNGIDITGYNFGSIDDEKQHKISNQMTVNTIETIITNIIDIKCKSINIFNEDSKFLIWRKIDDIDQIGWYILRCMTLEQREEIIKNIDDDQIIIIPIDDDDDEKNSFDALITVTTLKEQQTKSYYTASSYSECCLFPGEKLNMMFELLQTNNQLKEIENTEKNGLIQIIIPDDDL